MKPESVWFSCDTGKIRHRFSRASCEGLCVAVVVEGWGWSDLPPTPAPTPFLLPARVLPFLVDEEENVSEKRGLRVRFFSGGACARDFFCFLFFFQLLVRVSKRGKALLLDKVPCDRYMLCLLWVHPVAGVLR